MRVSEVWMRPSGMVLLMVTVFAVSYRTEAYHNHHQFSSPNHNKGCPGRILYQDHIHASRLPNLLTLTKPHCVPRPAVLNHAHTRKVKACKGWGDC